MNQISQKRQEIKRQIRREQRQTKFDQIRQKFLQSYKDECQKQISQNTNKMSQRADQDPLQYADFINKRLRQITISQQQKSFLLKQILIMIEQYHETELPLKLARSDLFRQIVMFSKFGQISIKAGALNCMISMIGYLVSHDDQTYYEMVQTYGIMEILVLALDLSLQNDSKYGILEILCLIFERNEKYKKGLMKRAQNYGLKKHLYRFSHLNNNKKLSQIAEQVSALYFQ